MHIFFMTRRDIYEAMDIAPSMATKMIKLYNEDVTKRGYTLINNGTVHIKTFCEFHHIDHDQLVENILEIRKIRPKYSRTSPL